MQGLLDQMTRRLSTLKRIRGDLEPLDLKQCRLDLELTNGTRLSVVLVEGKEGDLRPAANLIGSKHRKAKAFILELEDYLDLSVTQVAELKLAAEGDHRALENRIRQWQASYGRLGEIEQIWFAIEDLEPIVRVQQLDPTSEEHLLGKSIKRILTAEQQERLLQIHRDRELKFFIRGLSRVASLRKEKVDPLRALLLGVDYPASLNSDQLRQAIVERYLTLDDEQLSFLSRSERAATRRLAKYHDQKH